MINHENVPSLSEVRPKFLQTFYFMIREFFGLELNCLEIRETLRDSQNSNVRIPISGICMPVSFFMLVTVKLLILSLLPVSSHGVKGPFIIYQKGGGRGGGLETG